MIRQLSKSSYFIKKAVSKRNVFRRAFTIRGALFQFGSRHRRRRLVHETHSLYWSHRTGCCGQGRMRQKIGWHHCRSSSAPTTMNRRNRQGGNHVVVIVIGGVHWGQHWLLNVQGGSDATRRVRTHQTSEAAATCWGNVMGCKTARIIETTVTRVVH